MNNKPFYIDRARDISISFSYLLDDIKQEKVYTNYCQADNFYKVFRNIVISILLDREIVLIDSDFSDKEKSDLLGAINEEKIVIENLSISSVDEIQERIKSNKKWKLTLFTSGTTGKPKSITHTYSTLIDNVRVNSNKKNDVWGYAYSPTHMAGVQVFFQALLNGNTIVNLFNHKKTEILESIERDNVTHISATPTFYKLLLPTDSIFEKIKRVTFGGEKLSNSLKDKLNDIFPKAKFLNIYASTEAGAIFAAEGEIFKIRPNMQHLVKVEEGVLYIHKTKIGNSEGLLLEGDWYNSGDLVEVLEENPLSIRFLSRKNEMLNVGGYKVNPYEVEDVIASLPEVKDVRVFGKPNSVLGNIVCADIVLYEDKELTKQDIISLLKEKLQEFKIPRIIKFLDVLEKTRTGKVKRQ